MTFKPSAHGWAFDDALTVQGPDLGLGAAPAFLRLGGGMCWAALDRFLDGRAVPQVTSPPAPDMPLHAELRRRQIAALDSVWPRLREWQGLPDGSWRDRIRVPLTPGRRDIASLTRREWPRIRRELRAGRPVLLTLVEAADGYSRASAARQVLVFDQTRNGAAVVLSVYDPSRPGDDEVRLAFSLRGPLQARLTGGHAVRGFFAVPYDRTPAAALGAETFAHRSVLGLNRKVHGRPSAAAARRGLHIIARDDDGALLHFHRRTGRHWEGANVTEREELGAHELHSDPATLAGPGGVGLHAFARSYVGDLLHFRSFRRRWRVTNRTDHRRAGPRFRLEGNPVPASLPWGGACVVGRGKDGSLVAYSFQPFRGWRAEEVPAAGGGAITGDPTVVRIGPVVHVIARGRGGNLLHFERVNGGWSAGDLKTLCPGIGPASGAPVLVVHEERLHLLVAAEEGHMLHLERDPEGQWTSGVVATGISGDPAAANGPGGIHAFAPSEGGGLIHAWGSGKEWEVEDLVETRAGISPDATPASGLVAWGSEDELRVLGRGAAGLVHWVWRADTDWVAGAIAERAGVTAEHEPREAPLLVSDWGGGFHVIGTDGSGTVVHLEAVPWRAPGDEAAAPVPAAAPRKAAAASPKLKATPRPVPRGAMELLAPEEEAPPPLPMLDEEPVAEPVGEDDAGEMDLPALVEDDPAPWETSPPSPAAAETDAPLLDEEPIAEPVEDDDAGEIDLPALVDEPAPWETSAASSAAAEADTPLLDDEPVGEPVEEDDAGEIDLPFLLEDEPAPWETSAVSPTAPEAQGPELEDGAPEWESTTADRRPRAESVEAELEPLDLENLASWMNPTPAAKERPQTGPASEPPPAWPDLD